MKKEEAFKEVANTIYRGLMVLFSFVGVMMILIVYLVADPELSFFSSEETAQYSEVSSEEEDRIEDGIHVRTGLVDGDGLMEVVNNCTNCHSARLVIQNRMSAERWAATIDWMQETQNLWDLGGNEEIIINYLVTNYPPQRKGRRQSLTNIDWYELDEYANKTP
ncbi:MAG: monoheme cytochrome C [Bacteroidota bacterium]